MHSQQRQQTDDDMITSTHTLIYSDDANATRAFLRDVLGWKYVAEDFDNDWLIFKSGSSEMGVRGPIEQCEYGRVIMMIVPARMTSRCISRLTSLHTIFRTQTIASSTDTISYRSK